MKRKIIDTIDMAIRSLEEKLPPFASAHSVATAILGENREKVVFVENDEWVEVPGILLFISEEVDRDDFFRKLEKTLAWNDFYLEWLNSGKSAFVVGDDNVGYRVNVHDQREKRSVVKNLPFALEVL